MPTFMTPVIFQGPRYSERERYPRWKRHFLERLPRPLVGINVFVLKDDYVDNTWPKVTEVQPDERWIDREYLGARKYEVSEDEAALLRSFGYPMLGEEEVVTPPVGPTFPPVITPDPVDVGGYAGGYAQGY